jgi:hypothetical protein
MCRVSTGSPEGADVDRTASRAGLAHRHANSYVGALHHFSLLFVAMGEISSTVGKLSVSEVRLERRMATRIQSGMIKDYW